MIQLNQSEFMNLLKEVGADGWHLYSALRLLASDETVQVKQSELADLLGISSTKTVYNRMGKLSGVVVDGKPLVEMIDKKQDGNVYRLQALEVSKILQVGNQLPVSSNIYNNNYLKDINTETSKKLLTCNELLTSDIEQQKPISEEVTPPPALLFANGKDALTYWRTKYEEVYAVEYKTNWGKDTKLMKGLLEIYGSELLKNIIDVVFRHFDKKWKSQKFTRPTVGALSSWIAAQAQPFATLNQEAEKETVEEPIIKTEEGSDLLSEWEAKGWL